MAKDEPQKKSATLQAFFKAQTTEEEGRDARVKRPSEAEQGRDGREEAEARARREGRTGDQADGQWTGQVPYAAVAATFSPSEATTKRLEIRAMSLRVDRRWREPNDLEPFVPAVQQGGARVR